MSTYNTNLAAEFYVLSVLHRLGAEANLTLGNKKSVDIVVVRDVGNAATIDVKGLAGKTCWPIDNFRGPQENHFLVLVCFLDKISDPTALPEIYIVPSARIPELRYTAPAGRKVINLYTIRKKGQEYRDAWHLIMQVKTQKKSQPHDGASSRKQIS